MLCCVGGGEPGNEISPHTSQSTDHWFEAPLYPHYARLTPQALRLYTGLPHPCSLCHSSPFLSCPYLLSRSSLWGRDDLLFSCPQDRRHSTASFCKLRSWWRVSGSCEPSRSSISSGAEFSVDFISTKLILIPTAGRGRKYHYPLTPATWSWPQSIGKGTFLVEVLWYV